MISDGKYFENVFLYDRPCHKFWEGGRSGGSDDGFGVWVLKLF